MAAPVTDGQLATAAQYNALIQPSLRYTVTPTDLLNAVVIGPFQSVSFQAILKASDNYNGDTMLEYLDVAGAYDGVTDAGGGTTARADSVTQIGSGGGAWGGVTGNTRPALDASARMTLRVRVNIQATIGSCTVLILTRG